MSANRNYILITAAHNEQDFIENTILSVINQNIKPVEWIIVNDASNDLTEEIIKNYLPNNPFIKLINNFRRDGRDFASKVFALNLGLKSISYKEYNYLGILDADVSFEPDFYEKLLIELENDQSLGIVGGTYFDIINGKKKFIKPVSYSIRGATQFFRRECFEQIGGLQPIKYGGEDALACYSARMYGWKLKNIENLFVLHLRPTGMARNNIFRTRIRDGFVEYNLGYHPLFQFIKCFKRINERPIIISSILRLIGFWAARMILRERSISNELLDFIKKDQIRRINIFNNYTTIIFFLLKKFRKGN